MKFDIIEETVMKTKLIVRCKIEIKQYAEQETLIVNTKDVIEKLSSKYEIVKAEKEDEIWNYLRGNKNNHGLWEFKIKQKKPEPKPEPELKPEPEPATAAEPNPEPVPKPAVKSNIRQRFKKLAKTKKE